MPGVYRAVAFAKGVAVIFHSPKGCAHIASTLDIGSQYRNLADGFSEMLETVPLISSNIREKDSIFGGTDRLRGAIQYTVDTYHPACIVIAVSCMAGIIGDDVETVAEEAESSLGIPVMAVTAAGFLGGEYGTGYEDITHQIMQRFFKQQPHVPGRVLLLGDQMGPWGQYAREVKDILSWFGLEARWQFPGYVPFEEWKDLPSASLQILLGSTGQGSGQLEKLGKHIEKDYGIPVLGQVYPIGWENTCLFIRTLASYLGTPDKGEAFIARKEQEITAFVSSVSSVTAGKEAVICIGRESNWYDPTDTIHTLQRLRISISAVVLYDNLPEKDKQFMTDKIHALCRAPILSPADGQSCIESADLCLTTHEILELKTRQLFIPMIALVGAGGEMQMLRAVYRLLCQYGEKRGIAYV